MSTGPRDSPPPLESSVTTSVGGLEGNPTSFFGRARRRLQFLSFSYGSPGSPGGEEPPPALLEFEDDDVAKEKISLHFVHRGLMDHVRDAALINELFVYIPFVILFVFASLQLYDTEQLHMDVGAIATFTSPKGRFPLMSTVNQSAWTQVSNNITDVVLNSDINFGILQTADHYKDYIDFLFNQLFGCDPKPGFDSLASSPLGLPFKAQIMPVGALRLRTQRVSNTSCSITTAVQSSTVNKSNDVCYANLSPEEAGNPPCWGFNPFNKSAKLFRYVPCSEISGGTTTTTEFHSYHCGGYLLDIPLNTSCRDAADIAKAIKSNNCPFLDLKSTRFFIAEFMMYSVNTDVFLSSKQIIEISGGGGVTTDMQNRILVLATSRRLTSLIVDFVFLSIVLYYVVKFFLDWRKFYLMHGRILAYFANLWTLVEMVNVVTYLAMFVLRFWWWYLSTVTLISISTSTYPVQLEFLLFVFSQMRYALTFNLLLTFLKFIKFLKISDRLGVISVTFEKAQADVIGLLFLFVIVVVGYAVTGNILFGPAMPAFAALDRSFAALMFMLLGDLDYDTMKIVSPVLAAAYFWSFLILCFFLLLNFICAVISNAFSAAQDEGFVMPLSDSIEMVLEELVFTLRPTTIKYKFGLLRRGKSVTTVLAELASVVQDRIDKHRMNFPDQLDVTASAQEIYEWCGLPQRRDCARILVFKWRHFYSEYKIKQSTTHDQLQAERAEAISTGMTEATALAYREAPGVEAALDGVAAKGDRLMELLFSRGGGAGDFNRFVTSSFQQ